MAWPFKSGIIKVVVTYGFEGKPSINVHFVLMNSPVSPVPDADLVDAANAARNAWDTEWDVTGNAGWAVNNVTALDYSRENGNEIQTTGTLPIDGLTTGDATSSNVASVVSQRTPRTGRSYRGRNYVPGLSVSKVTDNTLSAGYILSLGDLYADFRSELAAVDMDHVVYSLYSGGVARVTPEATPITGTIVNDRVDTQRRRLPA